MVTAQLFSRVVKDPVTVEVTTVSSGGVIGTPDIITFNGQSYVLKAGRYVEAIVGTAVRLVAEG